MKILFVLEYHYPHIGGVETLFKLLTEQLVIKGYHVTVLTNRHSSELPKEEIINGVIIKRINFHNRYLFTLFAFFPALKLAKTHDLIHTTSYNAAFPAFFAALFSRKKVFITFHEVWGSLWHSLPYINVFSSFLHRSFESLLVKLPFHKFISVSKFTRQSLIKSGISPDRVIKIYNGIDYTDFESVQIKKDSNQKQNSMFQFCYFGRLGISKGLDILLPALSLCKSREYSFQCLLIIPSENIPFNTLIKQQLQDLGLEDVVRIEHDLERSQLLTRVAESDAVIIPSYSEGFGFTAVESMALGVPIISSGNGALSEVVSGQHLVFDPFTSAALAESMIAALENNWQHTEKKMFRLQDSIEGYCQLYESINH